MLAYVENNDCPSNLVTASAVLKQIGTQPQSAKMAKNFPIINQLSDSNNTISRFVRQKKNALTCNLCEM